MTLAAHRPFSPVDVMAEADSSRDERSVRLGKIVKERRLDIGLNRPAFVREMKRHGQDITSDYLNKLESGAAPLARASLEVREGIRTVLGWSAEIWQEKTGLYTSEAQDASSGFPVAPYQRRDEVYLPEGLKEAIKRFGDLPEYAALRNPDIQRQISLARNFNGPPETAAEWLRYFIANEPWFSKDKN